jgi:positive regulator of sigma E activity
MQIMNHYSAFIALIFPLGLLLLAVIMRQLRSVSRLLLLGGLLAFIVVGYYLLQTDVKGTPPNQVEALLAARDRPVFLELYSDY